MKGNSMRIFAILTCIFLYSNAFADESITHYTIQGQINNITDYGDYIWSSTSEGLVRINRNTFEQTVYNPSTETTYFGIVETGPDGTVWIMNKVSIPAKTGVGLYNFDGENWGYSQNRISSFTVDSQNRIWSIREESRHPYEDSHYVEYHQLLEVYNGTEWTTVADVRNDMNPFVCLALDEKTNTFWIGAYEYNFKISVYDDSTYVDEFKCSKLGGNNVPENVSIIDIDSKSVPWFLTTDKLYSYNNKTWETLPLEFEGGRTLFIDSNDIFWIGTGNGLIRYDGSVTRLYTTADGIIHNIVNSITEDDNGNIWFATSVGWSKFNGDKFESINYSAGLHSNYINNLYIDSSNAIWVGTDAGIDIFNGTKWKFYTDYDGLISNNLNDITEAPDNTFWVSQKTMISCFDGNTWTAFDNLDFLKSNSVEKICVDSKNNVWACLKYNYLSQFNGDTWKQYDYPVGQMNYFHGMICDNNDILWIIIRDNKNKYYLFNFSENHEWIDKTPEEAYEIFAVAKDQNNGIWLNAILKDSFKCALLYYDGTEWQIAAYLPEDIIPITPTAMITDVMAVDYSGKVWLGTKKSGVLVYGGNSWAIDTVAPGILTSNGISDIVVDKNNTVWVGTYYNGIVSIPQNTNSVEQESAPSEFSLLSNFPNPFNASTTVSFQLDEPGDVTLVIYNISGQKVRELVTESLPAGTHTFLWDGKDDMGYDVSSGMYLSYLKCGDKISTGKMVMIR